MPIDARFDSSILTAAERSTLKHVRNYLDFAAEAADELIAVPVLPMRRSLLRHLQWITDDVADWLEPPDDTSSTETT